MAALCMVFRDALAQASANPAQHLRDTGLFVETVTEIGAGIVAFSPQYPLWSDGAKKRRWISLPPGTFIDASRPDAWEFPRGTRLWKEFSHDRRVRPASWNDYRTIS
jgi:hypothetical protein